MAPPRWVSMPAQPIAIADLLAYLVAAIYPDSVTGTRSNPLHWLIFERMLARIKEHAEDAEAPASGSTRA